MSEKAGFGVIHSTSMERFQTGPALVSPFLFLSPDACGHSTFPSVGAESLKGQGSLVSLLSRTGCFSFAFSQPSWRGGGLAGMRRQAEGSFPERLQPRARN